MEKLGNKKNKHKFGEEEVEIKYENFIGQSRKLIVEKNNKLAEFYASLAMLDPKLDIFNKIRSIGILTYIRHIHKDAQIIDYLIYKAKKYMDANDIKNFDFSDSFCIIRVLYRGALVKLSDNDLLTSNHFLKEALNLFEEGKVNNEQTSKETIIKLFMDGINRHKEKLQTVINNFQEKRDELKKIKDVLERKKGINLEIDYGNQKEFYLISIGWVKLALPFLDKYSKQTNKKELFNLDEIYSKFISLIIKSEKKGQVNESDNYPGEINNHDILQHKDFWYDSNPECKNSNVFLSPSAKENQDFFYVSQEDWELLKSYFGCLNEIPRFHSKDSNSLETHLIRLKILVLNKHLKEKAIEYVRPRYIQVSKTDSVANLKIKIKRCVSDLFKMKLKHENHPEYSFDEVVLYMISLGMDKRITETIRLIHNYHTQKEKFIISANQIDDENISLNDLSYLPGDLIIAEIDGDFMEVLEQEKNKYEIEKLKTKINNMPNDGSELKEEIRNLMKKIDRLTQENAKLKDEKTKYKFEQNNRKQSLMNFNDSINSKNITFIRNQEKIDKIYEETEEKIKLMEIRNIKLEEEFCVSENYQDFICSICLNIVEDPVSCSSCESLNCKDCMIANKNCPKCRVELKETSIPRIVKNCLLALRFNCPLKCSKTFNYEKKMQHFSECVNKQEHVIDTICLLCNLRFNDSLKNHFKSCEKFICKCLFCDAKMNKLEIKEHSKFCKFRENFCEECKTEYSNRFEQAHSEYYCEKIMRLKKQFADLVQLN